MFITKLFSVPQLEVEWDNTVRRKLKPCYRGMTNANIPIRLIDLLKGLGSVQPKRATPSLISSLMDYAYLLDRISDTPELKLKIQETRNVIGSEMLTEVSELMGIGLSVVVVSRLFDVQRSTITKIIGVNTRRPDWTCYLNDGQILLVEAKGSISQTTSKQQLKDAVAQKNAMDGDVKVAAASVLNEAVSSKMTIVDPPVMKGGNWGEMQRHVYRANHYAAVFSFLGDDVLSMYFEKMAKRLSGRIREEEMEDKELMFNELRTNVPHVLIDNQAYSGHLYGPFDEQYLYIGVDIRLLYYRGFMDFADSEADVQIDKDNNQYLIHSDGVLVVQVNNPRQFIEEHHVESIGVSVDNIALRDVDSLRGNSFKRYVKYLLDKCFDSVKWIPGGRLEAVGRGGKMSFVVYHSNYKRKHPTWRQYEDIEKLMRDSQGVLVTNLDIPRDFYEFSTIGRSDLRRIAESHGDRNVVREILGLGKY